MEKRTNEYESIERLRQLLSASTTCQCFLPSSLIPCLLDSCNPLIWFLFFALTLYPSFPPSFFLSLLGGREVRGNQKGKRKVDMWLALSCERLVVSSIKKSLSRKMERALSEGGRRNKIQQIVCYCSLVRSKGERDTAAP
jgi:hypothetical protein